jgi:hypothetical protein
MILAIQSGGRGHREKAWGHGVMHLLLLPPNPRPSGSGFRPRPECCRNFVNSHRSSVVYVTHFIA